MTRDLTTHGAASLPDGQHGEPRRPGLRAERATEAARLRGEGLVQREIAERMGVSPSHVGGLLRVPDGTADRARKARWDERLGGRCVDCGS